VHWKRWWGNGESTFFWLSSWNGEAPFAKLFPRLFSLSSHKESMITQFCVSEGNIWNWVFSWRRELFQWEKELVNQLCLCLGQVSLVPEEDVWRWVPDPEGSFSVKSTYLYLENSFRSSEVLEDDTTVVFEHIWENPTPSKVIAFSW
jgi:hypothetical protein